MLPYLIRYEWSTTEACLKSARLPQSARMLVIQPWDASLIKEIEKAIQTSDIGINPANDGKVIRLIFPQPTEERRRELVRDSKKYGEDAKIAVRNIRRDFIERYKKMQKNNEITEDDLKAVEADIQKMTDSFTKNIDAVISDKEKERSFNAQIRKR